MMTLPSRTLFTLFLALVGMLVVPSTANAETPCSRTTKVEDFRQAQIEAEDAFALGDEAALHAARDAAVLALRCIGERLPGEEAAAFHRMIAMVAFTFGDESRVKGELQRAILLDPDYYDPGSVNPDDHRFIQLYAEAAVMPPVAVTLLQPPPGGFVMVDGVRDGGRPDGVACVVQVFNADYMLVETVYLPPGVASPSWGRTAEPLVDESFDLEEDEPEPYAPPMTPTSSAAPAAAQPGSGSPVLWLVLGVVGGVVVGVFLCCFLSFILYYSYY
jgi:hypothetical protein